VILLVAACAVIPDVDDEPSTTPTGDEALVVHVGDGDSLIVDIDGTEHRIRLIGLNAPERNECFGDEAGARLEALVLDRLVTLVEDVEAEDQYGRMLRYVYLGDVLINEQLVAEGFAMARSYEPNTAHQSGFDEAQDLARRVQAGMWATEACAVAGDLRIEQVHADAEGPDDENLNGEWIDIQNTGLESIPLAGWSLRDAESINRYAFPATTVLDPGARLRISTGCGVDDAGHHYWCSDGPIWNNRGDVAFLLNPDGKMADRLEY
jgi:micrococcal nuclease